MNKRRLYLVLSCILGILIVTSAIVYYPRKDSSFTGNLCVTDSDCEMIQTTCCPCSMGGQESCVLKSEVELYASQSENCSERTLCAAVYNCNQATCNCIKGKCIEISHS